MIQRADIHQRQGLLQALCEHLVSLAWLWISAWMVVREDHCRSIQAQRFLDHLAWVHRRTVDGAAEHLDVLDQAMLGIQKQC